MLFLCGFWAWSQFVQLWWQSVPQVPPCSPRGHLAAGPCSLLSPSLQAVRVTKPNIPETIRRNYELM